MATIKTVVMSGDFTASINDENFLEINMVEAWDEPVVISVEDLDSLIDCLLTAVDEFYK